MKTQLNQLVVHGSSTQSSARLGQRDLRQNVVANQAVQNAWDLDRAIATQALHPEPASAGSGQRHCLT
jgi:hypothetical protein